MTTATKIQTTPSQTMPHHHLSHVLSISFDYYGRRFATASYDRTVRVWDLNSEGAWIGSGLDNGSSGMNNEWQAHKGAVWDVCWGHPEFGQVLATAGDGGFNSRVTRLLTLMNLSADYFPHSTSFHSIDHAVIIWEEREGGFKSLATPERNDQGFLDTNVAIAAGGAGETNHISYLN